MKQFLNLDIWPHSFMAKKTQRTVKEDMKDKEWKKSYSGNKFVTVSSVSPVWLFSTPWTAQPTPQALLSMEFPRQEYWSGLSFPSPKDLSNLGIEAMSLALVGGFFYHWAAREARFYLRQMQSLKSTLLIKPVHCSDKLHNQKWDPNFPSWKHPNLCNTSLGNFLS